jgi:hypothetical protein
MFTFVKIPSLNFKIFLEMKGESLDKLCDDNWVQDLAFMVDIAGHLNDLNLKLQGKRQVVVSLYSYITVTYYLLYG